MSRRQSIQKLKTLKYQALTEKKDIKTPKIVCNFDEKQGHTDCQNINTCELNPTASRYKKGLESERLEAIEKEELRSMEQEGIVICNKTRCSQYGMKELCSHGVKHQWSESCTMQCNRYQDSYCKGA